MRAASDPKTLTLSRRIPAPLSRVWAAWTDPARLPLWWGPRGFTCRTKEMDLREGGQWRFDMIAPDGTIFVNRHRFVAIVPKSRIDYLLDDDGAGDHHFAATVRFAAVGKSTDVSLAMTFDTEAERAEVERFGAEAYGYTTLDCLAEAAMPGHALSITRLLAAPPTLVWRLWSEPEQLARWFVPDGMAVEESNFEPRAGRDWRTVLSYPDGSRHPVRGRFGVVAPPARLTFTHGWEDQAGGVPVRTRVSVALAPHGPGTRLTLVQEGLADAASRDGHFEGWSQTIDRLESAAVQG